MKKIGFIDFYLSEWHANNYPAWIREACAKLGLEYSVAYAYAERDVSPVDGVTTEAWCKKFGAEQMTEEQLVRDSDAIVVLAPSNPETHERLSALALASGKPVYVDKTFAPDPAAAQRMFRTAKAHGTPLYSSSALRFAEELAEFRAGAKAKTCYIAGGGNFTEYCVHVFEMAVTMMKPGAVRIRCDIPGDAPVFTADYGDGRRAVTIHADYPGTEFMFGADFGEKKFTPVRSDFFKRFIEGMLNFFETGVAEAAEQETLEVAKLIAAAKLARENPDQWIPV